MVKAFYASLASRLLRRSPVKSSMDCPSTKEQQREPKANEGAGTGRTDRSKMATIVAIILFSRHSNSNNNIQVSFGLHCLDAGVNACRIRPVCQQVHRVYVAWQSIVSEAIQPIVSW